MARPRTSPSRIRARERAAEAVVLRKAGCSFDEIARRLGFSQKGSAYRAVIGYIQALAREDAEALRELELQRLDALLKAIWPRALEGELAAIDRALRISERRARLCGLDLQRDSIAQVTSQVNQIVVSYASGGDWRQKAAALAQATVVEGEVAEHGKLTDPDLAVEQQT
jgi:hypothetical protein